MERPRWRLSLSTDADDTPDTLKAKALKELVQCEGWAFYDALLESDWGAEAVLQKTEQALMNLSDHADQTTVNDTVQQIHAARRAVQAMRRRPFEEIARLTPQKVRSRPFDALRRVAR